MRGPLAAGDRSGMIFDAQWLNSLAGRWEVERTATDGSRFAGEAVFAPGDEGLRLHEAGTLELATGARLAAERSWLWLCPAPGILEIRYPDGRSYHRFEPAGDGTAFEGGAVHLCGADAYEGLYRLEARMLVVRHRVRGPAKDYALEAVYTRGRG